MRWIEVAVDTEAAAEEAVAEVLMDAGCGGVAIVDPSAPLFQVRVSAYFPLDDSFEHRLVDIKTKIDGLNTFLDIEQPQITLRPVDEEDWATAWKAFFKPLKVGNVVIKPSWEDYSPQEGDVIVELDPGMAFGTGSHPTTQLCLLALQKYVPEGGRVLDMGCGSGILSMAAAKLGAGQVVGVDVDPVATEAAEKNVRAEGLQEKVDIRLGKQPPEGRFDLVLCNIIAAAIIALAERLSNALRPAALLISSGIIVERERDVRSKLESVGLETLDVMRDREWTALLSRRSG